MICFGKKVLFSCFCLAAGLFCFFISPDFAEASLIDDFKAIPSYNDFADAALQFSYLDAFEMIDEYGDFLSEFSFVDPSDLQGSYDLGDVCYLLEPVPSNLQLRDIFLTYVTSADILASYIITFRYISSCTNMSYSNYITNYLFGGLTTNDFSEPLVILYNIFNYRVTHQGTYPRFVYFGDEFDFTSFVDSVSVLPVYPYGYNLYSNYHFAELDSDYNAINICPFSFGYLLSFAYQYAWAVNPNILDSQFIFYYSRSTANADYSGYSQLNVYYFTDYWSPAVFPSTDSGYSGINYSDYVDVIIYFKLDGSSLVFHRAEQGTDNPFSIHHIYTDLFHNYFGVRYAHNYFVDYRTNIYDFYGGYVLDFQPFDDAFLNPVVNLPAPNTVYTPSNNNIIPVSSFPSGTPTPSITDIITPSPTPSGLPSGAPSGTPSGNPSGVPSPTPDNLIIPTFVPSSPPPDITIPVLPDGSPDFSDDFFDSEKSSNFISDCISIFPVWVQTYWYLFFILSILVGIISFIL